MGPMPGVNFYYVDDSGDESQDLLSALEVPAEAWRETLSLWLGWRRWLYKNSKFRIPASYEFHGAHFIEGRGEPVPPWVDQAGVAHAPALNSTKGLRREVYRRALRQIAHAKRKGVRLFTVHRGGVDKMATYHELLSWIDLELEAGKRYGFVMVDGRDPNYTRQHRLLELEERLVIEDVWMKDSAQCQFIQMADLCVHAAFQAIVRNQDKAFMWDWYAEYLTPIVEPGSEHGTLIRGL